MQRLEASAAAVRKKKKKKEKRKTQKVKSQRRCLSEPSFGSVKPSISPDRKSSLIS